MPTIIWPENTTEVIDAIRGAIGRDVLFNTVYAHTACPVCELDPITNTSIDSFCPVCSGIYWIPVWSGYTISGHVIWNSLDLVTWAGGGQLFDGDARVQIKLTDENLAIVDNAQTSGYVVLDGKTMEIKSRILRGVKNLNRILIDMIEKE